MDPFREACARMAVQHAADWREMAAAAPPNVRGPLIYPCYDGVHARRMAAEQEGLAEMYGRFAVSQPPATYRVLVQREGEDCDLVTLWLSEHRDAASEEEAVQRFLTDWLTREV